MPRRIYLQNWVQPTAFNGNAAPTQRGTWTVNTSAVVLGMTDGTYAKGAGTSMTATKGSTVSASTRRIGTWIDYTPIPRTGTLAGTMQIMTAAYESNLSMDAAPRVHGYVTVGETNVVRGTFLANVQANVQTAEWPGTLSVNAAAKTFTYTITSTAVTAGDRIILEIGYGPHDGTGTTTSTDSVTLYWGGSSATDLSTSSTNTDCTTTTSASRHSPWVEFSDTNNVLAAVGKTYYVSAAGSDAADGLTTGTPWASISKVNAKTFIAGDTILFRGGDSFSGQIYVPPGVAANATYKLTFSSYGTGRATITNGTGSGFYGYNSPGIEIDNLNFVGSSTNYDGIAFYRDLASRGDYIKVTNCDISGWKTGIALGATQATGGYSNVTFGYCNLFNNRDNGINVYGAWPGTGVASSLSNSSLLIEYCNAYDNKGNVANTTTNSGNGIVVGSTATGTIQYCTAYRNGELCTAPEGAAGIWTYQSDSITIQNCLAYDNRTGGTADGDGFDLDIGTSNSIIQYCLSYNNKGAGILLYADASNNLHIGNTVRYNMCWGNGTSNAYYGEITLDNNVRNAYIYNNTLISRSGIGGNAASPVINIDTGSYNAVYFINNIILQTGTGSLVSSNAANPTNEIWFAYNAYYSFGTFNIKWGVPTYSSVAPWCTAVSQEVHNSNQVFYQGDPMIIDPTSSPAITSVANLTSYELGRLVEGAPVSELGTSIQTLLSTSPGTRDYYNVTLAAPWGMGANKALTTVAAAQYRLGGAFLAF